MSKVSSVDYPAYIGGQVSINNKPVATSGLVNGVINSNYNMSDGEKAVYDYAQNALTSFLPQVNTFSPETLSGLQSQLNAYKTNGENTINSIYTPMIKNLENDVASRFGNFDNSIFMDNLSDIESKRSDAISSFAQDVLAKQSELEANELNNRYNFINLLNGLQNQSFANALSAINTTLGSTSNANNYSYNLYNALYKQYLQSQNSTKDSNSSIGGIIGLLQGNSFL